MTFPTDAEWDAQRDGVRQLHAGPITLLNGLLRRTDAAFTQTQATPVHTELGDAVLGHWARATAVSIGVLRLCENTYGDLAMILNRSLAEILGSVAWLLVIPEERAARAERFIRFVPVELEEQARTAERLGHDDELVRNIRAQIDPKITTEETAKLFPCPWRGWTGLRAQDIVAEVAPFWTPPRARIIAHYLLLAQNIGKAQGHAGAAITLNRVYVDGPDRTFEVKGNANHIDPALHVANILLSEITGICGEALGLEELRDLFPRRS
jgi:hypothetical protein